jgi:hypothetical protein
MRRLSGSREHLDSVKVFDSSLRRCETFIDTRQRIVETGSLEPVLRRAAWSRSPPTGFVVASHRESLASKAYQDKRRQGNDSHLRLKLVFAIREGSK